MSYFCVCGQALNLVELLDQRPANSIGRSRMLSAPCPRCGDLVEIRLNNGGYEVGYSYFGGSMHFESMHSVRLHGMTVTESDPDDLDVCIGERYWHFGIRHLGRQRFCVFAKAWAAGQAVAALDFAHFDVHLTGIERDRTRIDYDGATLIQPGDFLHLKGPSPALTLAWHYMNDGRI